MGREVQAMLADAGVKLRFYHPFRMARYTKYFRRTHRKMVIVDGMCGLMGGFNIGDEWAGDNGTDPNYWRDLQAYINGPAAGQLQSIFMEHWFEITGELLAGSDYFPEIRPAGNLSIRFIGSSPRSGSSQLQTIYLFALSSARKTFWMENAYFVPDKNSIRAFCDAARRGVDVRLILPAIESTDIKAPIFAAKNYYRKLLESGVKIYEYSSRKLHAKFAVADGLWTTIGTTNFDNRSFRYHEEINLNVYDSRFANTVSDIFLNDQKSSRQVDILNFKRRSVSSRIKEMFYKLFEEQL
jgi:cardiolipin synthase